MRLFIYCADPRAEADLGEKIQKLLRPGEKIARHSTFSGPLCFAYPEDLREKFITLMGEIRFFINEFGSDGKAEIVLVWHNCGFYKSILLRADKQTMKNDAIRGTEFLKRRIRHGARIASYYDNSSDNNISFEEIVAEPALVS